MEQKFIFINNKNTAVLYTGWGVANLQSADWHWSTAC